MDPAGLLLGALAALSWAALDVLRKRVGRDVSATTAVAALTLFQVPMLVGLMGAGELAGDLGRPWSLVVTGFPAPPSRYGWILLATVALNVLANWLFLRAVQLSPLGLTVPYLSFTPVFTGLSGLVALGEAPSAAGWAGIVVVTVGAFLLNPGNKDDGALAPLKALWRERGSLYMVVVALIWSVTPVFDKTGADLTNAPGHSAALAAGIFACLVAIRAVQDRGPARLLGELWRCPWLIGVAALVNVGAMVFQLASYHYADVAYVETLKRAVGVMASIVVGWWLFGERDLGRRLPAAVVMSAGVALIILLG